VPEWRKRRGRYSLESLVRQRVFQIACGYEDQDDADFLRKDPLLKLSCGSSPQSGAEPALLPSDSREALRTLYLRERASGGAPSKVLLDLDATADPTHGEQEGSYCHGYYKQHIYHPLLVFDGESGHLITALLRAANTNASNSCVALLKRVAGPLRERCHGCLEEEADPQRSAADAAGQLAAWSH
jgi:Transposase DDE domain group 1